MTARCLGGHPVPGGVERDPGGARVLSHRRSPAAAPGPHRAGARSRPRDVGAWRLGRSREPSSTCRSAPRTRSSGLRPRWSWAACPSSPRSWPQPTLLVPPVRGSMTWSASPEDVHPVEHVELGRPGVDTHATLASEALPRSGRDVGAQRSTDRLGRGTERRPEGRDVRGAFRRSSNGTGRRSTVNIAASTCGGGSNAPLGTQRATPKSHHGSHPSDRRLLGPVDARLRAASDCTSRSARTIGPAGASSNRRRIAVVSANGTLPKTRWVVRGSGTVKMSPATIATEGSRANRRRSRSTSSGSSSTAVTRRQRRARASVSRPAPAPISTRSSVAPMPARSTSSSAIRRLRRKCWPPGRWPLGSRSAARGRRSRAPTDHHRHHAIRLLERRTQRA